VASIYLKLNTSNFQWLEAVSVPWPVALIYFKLKTSMYVHLF